MTIRAQRKLKALGAALVAVFVFDGCCPIRLHGKNGTCHYIVIGAGIVSVNDSSPKAATVVRSHAAGVFVTDAPGMKLSAGYSSGETISIAEGAEDVRIEVRESPGGILKIEAPAALSKTKNQGTK
jgi:hypothetical protein